MAVTLPILDQFATSFNAAKSTKFPTKPIISLPITHLKYVAALP